VKDYSDKNVNKKGITTYEWYEHGEIKTITFYGTDYTRHIKYAENGAFICDEDISVKQ
jgi:tricorn protease-like protein